MLIYVQELAQLASLSPFLFDSFFLFITCRLFRSFTHSSQHPHRVTHQCHVFSLFSHELSLLLPPSLPPPPLTLTNHTLTPSLLSFPLSSLPPSHLRHHPPSFTPSHFLSIHHPPFLQFINSHSLTLTWSFSFFSISFHHPHSVPPSFSFPSLSLSPYLPHSLTPSLPHSLTPSLPHSLTPSLPHSLTYSLKPLSLFPPPLFAYSHSLILLPSVSYSLPQ